MHISIYLNILLDVRHQRLPSSIELDRYESESHDMSQVTTRFTGNHENYSMRLSISTTSKMKIEDYHFNGEL